VSVDVFIIFSILSASSLSNSDCICSMPILDLIFARTHVASAESRALRTSRSVTLAVFITELYSR
jgi:hypothetical protein